MSSSTKTTALGVCAACFWVCAGCGSGDALDSRGSVVARAGSHEISVDRLGEIVARGSYVPLEPAVVERMVGLWVDYSLVAQRLAAGDSLLDSATVVETMWREAQLQVLSHYYDDIVSRRVTVDAATIDSAYAAGEHRLIYHILVGTPAVDDPTAKAVRRRKAERLRAMASSGPSGWLRANRENEDSASQVLNGRFGLVTRGETLAQFDSVVFSLSPGEISEVTESELGYHVIRRPSLEEVRGQFGADVQQVLIDRMNAALVAELETRWEFAVAPEAPELMRVAASRPMENGGSSRVLARYRKNRFTVADLRRWLKALPVEYTAEARQWDDEQMTTFLRGLMRNEVLAREARDAGYELTHDGFTALRQSLAEDLDLLRSALGVDSLLTGVDKPDDRLRVAASAVDAYLTALTNDLALLVPVPPFLAEKLRSEMDWRTSRTALERALAHGARLRVLMEAAEQAEADRNRDTDSSEVREESDEL